MLEFKRPTTIGQVMAMAKGTQSFDTSLVEGFSYSAPTVTFYTASEGALLQSTIESPSFDYEAVVKAFC